jgi:hypothetical protein
MEINNCTNSYKYFHSAESRLIQNGFEFLNVESISSSNLVSHINNLSRGIERPDIYNEVIKDIHPIPPFSKWEYSEQKFCLLDLPCQSLNSRPSTIHSFIDLIKSKSEYLKNKKIAVELSGGLDSSIIIELLSLCGLEITLIGLFSNNYEFRTERIIQEHYAKSHDCFQIDSKHALPFSSLIKCPPHPLPTKKSLFFYQKEVIAKKCTEEKIDYLFNGIVGDTIFCDKIESRRWHKWEFDNNWFNDYVFEPNKVSYITTNFDFVLNYFFNQRKHEKIDPFKIWARNHFKDILPKTLSNYFYKTDHFEEIIEGIYSAEIDILETYKLTNSITKNHLFTYESFGNDLRKIRMMNDQEINTFFAKVSYSVWIYSLRNIINKEKK